MEDRGAKRILIVSDTHRHNENLFKILKMCGPFDMLVHCGDVENGVHTIEERAGCPVMIVAGNNDFFCDLPAEQEFNIGRYRVWLTHGHYYYASMGNETIRQEAEDREVDIVMYGHSHKPVIDRRGTVITVNPGSLTYPRQEGRRPSYIIMELDREGEAHFTIHFL